MSTAPRECSCVCHVLEAGLGHGTPCCSIPHERKKDFIKHEHVENHATPEEVKRVLVEAAGREGDAIIVVTANLVDDMLRLSCAAGGRNQKLVNVLSEAIQDGIRRL